MKNRRRLKPSRFRAWAKTLLLLSILGSLGACRSITGTSNRLGLPDGVVIFSFDDGPNSHGDTTARLLDILEKHHIRAMFALIGENVRFNPELVQQIHRRGHIIINHGYSDRWPVNMDNQKFYDNLIQGEAALDEVLGEPLPRLYRPGGGFYTKGQEAIWRSADYTMIPATARAYDAVLRKSDRGRLVSGIIKAIEKQRGGIILLHDARDSHVQMEAALARDPEGAFNRSWIPDAVEEIIDSLENKGYRLSGFDILGIFGLMD